MKRVARKPRPGGSLPSLERAASDAHGCDCYRAFDAEPRKQAASQIAINHPSQRRVVRDNGGDASAKGCDTGLIDNGRIGTGLPRGCKPPHFTLGAFGVIGNHTHKPTSMR